MSGYVPKRVANTRTAMGSTDQNSSGQNMLGLVSTIGRRRTNLREIQRRSFSSFLQLDYWRNKGIGCKYQLFPLNRGVPFVMDVATDNNTGGYIRSDFCTSLGADCSGTPYFGGINGYPQCQPEFASKKILEIISNRSLGYTEDNDFYILFLGYTTDNAPNITSVVITGEGHNPATDASEGPTTATLLLSAATEQGTNSAGNTIYKWNASTFETRSAAELLFKPSSVTTKGVTVTIN